MSKQRLCSLTDLEQTGAKGVTLADGEASRELFVARNGDGVYAYENVCPHTGGPLDWIPDQFLEEDGRLIVCATHAALFRIHDGSCIAGPCAGASLRAMRIITHEGSVFLDER